MITSAATRATGQVRGTVVDESGRGLPFAAVVSRTGNGFLAVWTGLDGSFAFPGRPHRPGHTITASSAGYRDFVYTLQAGDSAVVLTLRRSPRVGAGWAVGLPEVNDVSVLAKDGSVLQPGRDTLVTRASYRVRVRLAGSRSCLRPGPADAGDLDGTVTVAVAVFVRSGADCDDAGETTREVDVWAPGPTPTFRVIARYHDIVVRFAPVR